MADSDAVILIKMTSHKCEYILNASNLIFCSISRPVEQRRKNIKAAHHWPHVRAIHLDSLKRPVKRDAFQCVTHILQGCSIATGNPYDQ